MSDEKWPADRPVERLRTTPARSCGGGEQSEDSSKRGASSKRKDGRRRNSTNVMWNRWGAPLEGHCYVMSVPEIAFDEAENTGQNLLDASQPVFVSAGVRLSVDDIGTIRELLKWGEDEELHFVKLRKSRSGLDRIVELVHSPFVSSVHAKWMMIHKAFMITTKIVDILIEERAYRDGVDLYKDGAHLAMSNMFQLVLPGLFGQGRFRQLQAHFVDMVRTGKVRPIRKFYELVREMMDEAPEETMAQSLAPLLASAGLIGEILEMRSITDLDPAVPAFVSVAAAWDAEVGEPWGVVHDASKPIAFDQDLIECYMTDEVEPERFRESGGTFPIPLGATGIRFDDSAAVPALQIADVVASATAHYWRGVANPSLKDEAWVEIEDTPVLDSGVGGVWPLPLFTPKDLDMEGFNGRVTELAAELVGRGMRKKFGPDWSRGRRRRKGG